MLTSCSIRVRGNKKQEAEKIVGAVTPRGSAGSAPSSGTASPVRLANKNGLRLKKLPPVQHPVAVPDAAKVRGSVEEAAHKVKLGGSCTHAHANRQTCTDL